MLQQGAGPLLYKRSFAFTPTHPHKTNKNSLTVILEILVYAYA